MVSWSYVTMSQTLMAQRTQPWGLQPCSATAAAGLAVGVEALPPEEVLLPNQEAHHRARPAKSPKQIQSSESFKKNTLEQLRPVLKHA